MIIEVLENRIRKGHEAIKRARAQYKDTQEWEAHLAKLERKYVSNLINVDLDEFSKRNIGIEIFSKVLNCEIWFCSNIQIVKQIKEDSPGSVCFVASELAELIKLNPDKNLLNTIYETKKTFENSKLIKCNTDEN